MYETVKQAQEEFEKCWLNPLYTAIELDDVDVNQTLAHYKINKPIEFTKKMLWDLETKIAWDPASYIPYVVREGSAKSWEKQSSVDGETFVRESEQKQWLNPDIYEKVYEEVYVNHHDQVVTFLGVISLPGRAKPLQPKQPLFHVQHAVGGVDRQPLNKWRIVFLTDKKDANLIEHFKSFNDPTTLPGFIEMYLKKDLGAVLNKV